MDLKSVFHANYRSQVFLNAIETGCNLSMLPLVFTSSLAVAKVILTCLGVMQVEKSMGACNEICQNDRKNIVRRKTTRLSVKMILKM